MSARRQPPSLRAAATIQPAPAARAVWTATWPTIPEAPSTSTRSPGTIAPRLITGIHPASPATPIAAATDALTSSGTGTSSSSGATKTCAKRPVSPRLQTRVPTGNRSEAITMPTASTPGDARRLGQRQVEAPRGDREVDGVQPGRLEADQRLTRPGRRLRPVPHRRDRPVLVDDDRPDGVAHGVRTGSSGASHPARSAINITPRIATTIAYHTQTGH